MLSPLLLLLLGRAEESTLIYPGVRLSLECNRHYINKVNIMHRILISMSLSSSFEILEDMWFYYMPLCTEVSMPQRYISGHDVTVLHQNKQYTKNLENRKWQMEFWLVPGVELKKNGLPHIMHYWLDISKVQSVFFLFFFNKYGRFLSGIN